MYCSGDIFTFYLCPMQFYFVFECAQALFINVKTENSKIHIFQIQIIVSKISWIDFACFFFFFGGMDRLCMLIHAKVKLKFLFLLVFFCRTCPLVGT